MLSGSGNAIMRSINRFEDYELYKIKDGCQDGHWNRKVAISCFLEHIGRWF